jgi:hypothetical protein
MQALRLADHLNGEPAIMRSSQNDFVYEFCARHSREVADPTDHPLAKWPLVVQKPAHCPPHFRMPFHVGRYPPSYSTRADNQHISDIAIRRRAPVVPGGLPAPSPQRSEVEYSRTAVQCSDGPWKALQSGRYT